MKYLVCFMMLLYSLPILADDNLNQALEESQKEIRASLKRIDCMMALHDDWYSGHKACYYYGRVPPCQLTEQESLRYIDHICK